MKKLVLLLISFLFLTSVGRAQDFGYLTNMGIGGGELGDVAINPTTPEVMYVATTWGDGIFKSTDEGTTWSTIESLRGKNRGSKVVFNPSNPNIVYYARFGEIYKSVDGGTNWIELISGVEIYGLAIASSDPNVLYASCLTGRGTANEKSFVIKSTDGGTTWAGTGFPTIEGLEKHIECVAVHPSNPNLVFAGSGVDYRNSWGNLWKTSDGGNTWKIVINGTQESNNLIGYDLAFKGTKEAYVPARLGVYKSSDSSFEVWELVLSATLETSDPQHGAALSVAVASNGTIYAGTKQAIYKSSNSGVTWDKTSYTYGNLNSPVLNIEPRQVRVHPTNPNIIYAGSGFGLHKSTDGGTTWSALNTGLTACQIWAVKKSGSVLLAGGERSVWKSVDGGSTWEVFKATPTRVRAVAVDPKNSNKIFIAYGGGDYTLAYTSDGGTTWSYPLFVNNVFEVSSFAINPVTPEVVYAAGGDYVNNSIAGAVYKSTNGGASWEALTGIGTNCVQVVKLDPKNPDVVYAGVSAIHYPNTPGGLYKSINGGASWEALLSSAYPINDILIDSNVIYVALTAYASNRADTVYKSIDGGKNWSNISTGISSASEGAEVTSLAFDAADTRIIYAGVNGGHGGVYYTTNRGESWSKLVSSLYDIMDVETGSLYVGTSGGLFSYAGTQPQPYAGTGDKPVIYNYPNPFNPAAGGSTVVSFSLPSGVSGSTTVKIFDLSGELVKTLVGESKSGGATYTANWDGKNDNGEIVASGVYIALIIVDGKPQYSKIAVIK